MSRASLADLILFARDSRARRMGSALGRRSVAVSIPVLFAFASSAQAQPTPAVCDRTAEVRDLLVVAAPESACADVTAAHLAALDKFDLSMSSITSLAAGDFNGLTAVEHLDLSGNSLQQLPAGIFDELTLLAALSLSNNQLQSLPPGVFDNNPMLVNLDLAFNQLSSFPDNIFAPLTALPPMSGLVLSDNPGSSSAAFDPRASAGPDQRVRGGRR